MAAKLNAKSRMALNELNRTYHDFVPLDALFKVAELSGLMVVDEDGSPWEGVLCGEEGTVEFSLMDARTKKWATNGLHASWYRMPSGRYELNCYLT